jgi:hypothetical protein
MERLAQGGQRLVRGGDDGTVLEVPVIDRPVEHVGGIGGDVLWARKRYSRGGASPASVSRRQPAAWERVPGVENAAHELSQALPPDLFRGMEAVIHCAAATAGGWDEHK